MKYSIKGKPGSLRIDVKQLGGKQQAVLESMQACANGKCECPTPQYDKLASIHIAPGPDSISIELRAREGETIQ